MSRRRQKNSRDGMRVALAKAHAQIENERYGQHTAHRALNSMCRQVAAKAEESAILRGRINVLERECRDIGRLANHFSLHRAPPIELRNAGKRDFYVNIHAPLQFHSPYEGVMPSISRREIMRVLSIEEVKDQMAGMIHMRIDLGNGQFTYAISEQSLLHAPLDVLLPRIGEEIAEGLLTVIRRR